MKNLVLLLTHYSGTLRHSAKAHINAFRKYSKNIIIEINTAFSVDWRKLRQLAPNMVILHTSFLSTRWGNDSELLFKSTIDSFADIDCVKIAFPQDEYFDTQALDALFVGINIDAVYTCAKKQDLPKIYPKCSMRQVRFEETLTGYIDENLLKRHYKKQEDRPLDIVYRAWQPYKVLGKKASIKAEVANVVTDLANKSNLRTDISVADNSTLLRKDWIRLLSLSKTVIGMEGGASILDFDGSLCRKADRNLEPPEGRDGEIDLFCISPRHFEAAITQTVQILVKGDYSGVLKANKHYVELDEDFGNLDEALQKALNPEIANKILSNVQKDILDSGCYSYRSFVSDFETRELKTSRKFDPKNWNNLLVLKTRAVIIRSIGKYTGLIQAIIKLKNSIAKQALGR